MNYTELVAAIAANAGVSKVKTKNVVDATIKTLNDMIAEGEEIAIPGFGKFYTRIVGERECMNFATGEKMLVPEHRAPAFKFSSLTRKAVKELEV